MVKKAAYFRVVQVKKTHFLWEKIAVSSFRSSTGVTLYALRVGSKGDYLKMSKKLVLIIGNFG